VRIAYNEHFLWKLESEQKALEAVCPPGEDVSQWLTKYRSAQL